MRAEVVPDLVMEHPPHQNTHSLTHLPSSRRIALLFLAPLFNRFCFLFPQERSLHKPFRFSLLYSLHTVPLQLSLTRSLSCMGAKNRLFIHRKKKKVHITKLSVSTKEAQGAQKRQNSQKPTSQPLKRCTSPSCAKKLNSGPK